ncbi:hypothetical protein Dda_1879 [Drechslerella dactyloides]|uniref:Uncharacterized protein n=1 Tax=Drechslerella dactyloides TaxID=74499 RepID=A0AAD6J3C3_DREDA|nr:hypothetical protein Dda_1879 [Drechslerella dactyloides]
MSRRINYFANVMGMCDPDRYSRPSLAHRPASSFTSWSLSHSDQVHHGNYYTGSGSGMTTPDSRSGYNAYPYYGQAALAAAPQQSHYPPRHLYQPRMAGASTRRGGFRSPEDAVRSAKEHNAELSGEYEKFRPLPIILSDGSLEFPDEFPVNAHELFLMDLREMQDLCSLFRIDGGRSRSDHIHAFLKYIGAVHVSRGYDERDNYGCEY